MFMLRESSLTVCSGSVTCKGQRHHDNSPRRHPASPARQRGDFSRYNADTRAVPHSPPCAAPAPSPTATARGCALQSQTLSPTASPVDTPRRTQTATQRHQNNVCFGPAHTAPQRRHDAGGSESSGAPPTMCDRFCRLRGAKDACGRVRLGRRAARG
jgi:hypothetical protein